MGYNNNNNYNSCDPCGNNKINAGIPESVIRLLRYLKDPVLYLHNLYGNFPDGGELGWFAYVVDENKFATWDVDLKRWKYMTSDIEKAFAILAGSVNSICMIAESYKDNITGLSIFHTEKLASDYDILIKKRDILFAELYNVPIDRALRSEDIKRMEVKYEAFNDAVKEFFGSYQLALNYKHDTSLNGFLLINTTVQSSTNLVTSLYQNVEPTALLTTFCNQHIVAKNALNSTISNSVSDSELSASELTDIQAKYKTYNDTISAFIAEYQSIQNKGLKDVEDWMTDTTNGLILFVSTINSTTETAKSVYANVGGTTTQKVALKTKYDAFIQTDSQLTTLIGNSLSDSKLSSTELASIITKYQKYNSDLFGFYAELKKLEENRKQNQLVPLDDTIVLEEKPDGTTGIKAILAENVQTIVTGGTKVLEVEAKIVRLQHTSQLMVIGIDSELNYLIFINESALEAYFSFNAENSTNKLLKTDVSTIISLPKWRVAHFLKTIDGWILMKETAYFPDLSQENRIVDQNIHVKNDGLAKLEDIQAIEEIDESVTSLTTAQLNERYPNAVGGFKLICNGVMYIKSSHFEGKWQSLTLNTLS